jgi:hypothetical protein
MLTPGVAGLTTTMITGTLASVFGLPGSVTGLAVSFVIGLVVWSDTKVAWPKRLLLYVINSMVIFTVAMGINQAGVAATRADQQPDYRPRGEERQPERPPFFHPWL